LQTHKLLNAHIRILRKLEKAGEDGVVASELVPERSYREFVLRYLCVHGLIERQKRFRGERVFITEKGLSLIYKFNNGHEELPD